MFLEHESKSKQSKTIENTFSQKPEMLRFLFYSAARFSNLFRAVFLFIWTKFF